MSDAPELRIVVAARPENVAVVRRAITGIGEAVGLEESGIGDLQTIVTEASMNVVVHAYENGDGPLEVTGLDTNLPVHSSLDGALEQAAAKPEAGA